MSDANRTPTALLQPRLNRRAALQGAGAIGLATSLGVAPSIHAQEKTQIRLGTWAAVDEANELQAVLDEVNAAAEDFEIISEPQPADYYTKLQTTIAGGTGPDLFWLSQEFVAGYADLGAILDISDMLEADDTPAADLSDYFEPILKTAQYDGKTFGLPWISQPVMLYYNVKMFEEAGIDPPDESWDWAKFQETAAALTDTAAGVYGTSFNSWPPIHMFIWQAGGETITPERDACPIDTEEAIAGAQFYADIIYKEEYAAPEAVIAEQGFGEMMKAGKVGIFYGGAADDLDYAYKKDPANAEIRMALVPSGPASRATFAWTASTVINAEAENPEIAYKALVALTEGIHHWKIVAPRQSLANEETIAEAQPDKAESAAIIVQAMNDMRTINIIPEQAEWDITFSEEYQTPLFFDEGTAEELAPEVRPMLEDLLP
ncbi:MAG TPA: sugar ABC transporter substrate-binding protein [Thermomicrobiales bacterium]|nr:sugar ABC transporter substrate-binding protein [Thermomicrobiales bacterium]